MFSLQTIFGSGQQFYTLLDEAAQAAHDSAKALQRQHEEADAADTGEGPLDEEGAGDFVEHLRDLGVRVRAEDGVATAVTRLADLIPA